MSHGPRGSSQIWGPLGADTHTRPLHVRTSRDEANLRIL